MAQVQEVAKLRAYAAAHPGAVLFDEAGDALLDVFAAKAIPARAAELRAVEERRAAGDARPYLLLVYGDGRQLALTDAGVGFAPDPRNTGPLPELPPVVCLRDLRTIADRVRHELYGHPDRPPTRDAVKLVMMCIAILDGARAHGFDVGREEGEVEALLSELERRGAGRG